MSDAGPRDLDPAAFALTKDKVVATVVRIMELTCIRVGNAAYAAANGHFGLTTLRNRHAKIGAGNVSFAFVGKSGVARRIALRDARLAAIVRRCRDLPGQPGLRPEERAVLVFLSRASDGAATRAA